MFQLLCAIACGLGFAVSLPPYDCGILCWVAIAPLLYAACGRRPLEAVGLGLVAGLVCAVFQGRWHEDTTRLFWGYLPFLWVTVFFALAALASCLLRPRLTPAQWVAAIACAGIALEWVTTWLPLPVHIALTQYRNVPLIQIASITGIWGVSLLLWTVNAAIADAFLSRRALTVPIRWCAAALPAVLAFGALEIRNERSDPGRPFVAAAIQDFSGDETGGLAPDPLKPADRDMQTVEATSGSRPARLVVWSEECLGYGFDPAGARDATRKLARERNAVLVAGFNDTAHPKPHNCAAVVNADGATAGVFQKMHLYLSERQTNIPGAPRPAVDTAVGKVGAEVCFDSCYTGVTRGLAASGAQVIAMPNYDPPTPRGVLHNLHSAILPFRAVENHVPFVRSDSNGLSQVIDSRGRILAEGPLYRAAIVSARIVPGDGRGTFFTKTGDWLAWLCIGGFLLLARKRSLPLQQRGARDQQDRSGDARGIERLPLNAEPSEIVDDGSGDQLPDDRCGNGTLRADLGQGDNRRQDHGHADHAAEPHPPRR